MAVSELEQIRADETESIGENGVIAYLVSMQETRTELGGRHAVEHIDGSFPADIQARSTVTQLRTEGGGAPVAVTIFEIYLPWDAPVNSQSVLKINGINYTVVDTNAADTGRYSLRCNVRTQAV